MFLHANALSSQIYRTMFRPDVTPDSPLPEQPTIGLIGMGAMGKMYAKYLSGAGWKKYATVLEFIPEPG